MLDLAGPGGEHLDAELDELIERVRRAAMVVVKRRELRHPRAADQQVTARVDLADEVASEAALPLQVVNAIIRGLTA